MNISIKDFLKIQTDVEIIDIRSVEKYNSNHIEYAKNIPYQVLLSNPYKYLDKNRQYYIYCQKGLTSINVCNQLLMKGFKVINIVGGYEKWLLEK